MKALQGKWEVTYLPVHASILNMSSSSVNLNRLTGGEAQLREGAA